jgi:hypothetical protein
MALVPQHINIFCHSPPILPARVITTNEPLAVPIQLGCRPSNRLIHNLNPLAHRNPQRPSPSRLRRHSIARTRLTPRHLRPSHPALLQLPILPLHPDHLARRIPHLLKNLKSRSANDVNKRREWCWRMVRNSALRSPFSR